MQKDNETQLLTQLTLQIGLTLAVWLAALGYATYRLFQLAQPSAPTVISGTVVVPSLSQSNLNLLRTSLKATETISLPINQPEPFD